MESFISMFIILALVLLVAPILVSIIALTRVSECSRMLKNQEQFIHELLEHIGNLEHRLKERTGTEPPPPPATAPTPAPVMPETPVTPPLVEDIPTPWYVTPTFSTGETRVPSEHSEALEETVGKRWITWGGTTALFLATAFFIKYAIDVGWLGPSARITLGILFGLAMLLVGDRLLRRNMRPIGEGLMGGGLAIIYLCLYAGFAFYHLLSAPAAFSAMVALTGLGMALAVIDNALALSVLAVLGGLFTPIMVSTGADARDILFTYLLVLNLGVVGVAFFKQWRALDTLAFTGTWLLYFGWFVAHYSPQALTPAMTWVLLFYLLFLALPFIFHLRFRTTMTVERFLTTMLNAVLTMSFAYAMLYDGHRFLLGFIALGISATSLLMASLTRRRVPGDAVSLFGFITLAVTALTLAIPLELKAYGISMLWAVEGPVLLYLGYRFRYFPVRAGGFIVLLLAVGRLFVVHWPLHDQQFIPFLNFPFLGAISIPLSIGAYAMLGYRRRQDAGERDDTMMLICIIGSGLLGLLLLQTELGKWLTFTQHPRMAHYITATLWAAGGLLLAQLGVRLRRVEVQTAGFVPLLIAVIAGVHLYADSNTGWMPILNPRFVVNACVVLCFFLTWWTIRRGQGRPDLQLFLFTSFQVCLFTLLSLDVYSNGENLSADPTQAHWIAQMSLSITWGIYAIVLLVIGFWQRSRGMRLTALCIFGATVLKLVIIDLAVLEQIYRILSFFVLGLLMIGASYLYHRVEKRLATTENESNP